MLKTISKQKSIIQWSRRNFSQSTSHFFKVAVCGACGGIGAPLSLLLKMSPLVTELRLHDIAKHMPGVALDIAHIEYPARVTSHLGCEDLKGALQCADIVAIPAGVPRKPGMNRDDLFSSNAIVVKSITEAVAQHCPLAMVAIITNPINTVIPIACEVMKSAGKLDPKRIFGITTLDNVRSATFVAEKMKISPKDVSVPVIGGHSGDTIVPLFSRSVPKVNFPLEEIKALTLLVGEAGTHVVKAKAGAGSATLSMAYAAARFLNSLMCAMKGEPNVVECTYIKTDICKSLEYFSGPVVLGKNGAEKMCPIGTISDYETELLAKAVPVLQKNIQKGKDYVKNCSLGAKAATGSGSGKDPCAKESKPDPCATASKPKDPCAGESKPKDPCAGESKTGGATKKDFCGGASAEKDPCSGGGNKSGGGVKC